MNLMMKFSAQHPVLLFLVLTLLCGISPAATVLAKDISVQATLQPTHFSANRNARLTIRVNGASSARPEQPHADGLQFFSRGQSTQMQWINGKSSSSVTFTYMVQATKPGSHTIDPITVLVDGSPYATKAIKCVVAPAATTPVPQTGRRGGSWPARPPFSTRLRSGEADQVGFMRILPQKESAYAGELLPFTIKAYFRQGMRVTIKANPRLTNDNFILESLDDKPGQSEEIVNGIPYTLLTWQGAVSAVKQGNFPMEVEMNVSLLVRSRRQRPSSMFGSPLLNDPFFDDFFGGYTQKEITLISPKHTIQVNDLPQQGKPAAFSGAIGSFSLAVKAEPTVVQSGDPISLKMIISGSGNFDRVKPPVFSGTGANWKTYPPSAGKVKSTGGTEQKEFEQAIIPTNPGVRRIPAITFAYFDPKSKKYVSLRSDPIAITLKRTAAKNSSPQPGAQTSRPQPLPQPAQAGESEPKQNLAPIHTHFGESVHELRPLYRKAWFQVLITAALLILISALVLLQQRQRLAANPELKIKKELNEKITQLLAQAEQAMRDQDSSRFLAICRHILQQRFGFAWQVEPQAICAADLAERLGNDSPLPKILTQAEHAAYTGEQLAPSEMEHIFHIVQQEARQL